MLLFLRKAIFYILLVLYLVMTPYVILYALGYVIQPGHTRVFLKTGLISVISSPKDATVYLDGKRFSQRTPAIIRDLLPGQYQVRITQKNYDTWEKEVTVESEKVAALESIILLPHHPSREVVSEKSFENLAPSLLESKILAMEEGGIEGLWKIESFFKKATPIGTKPGHDEDVLIRRIITEKGSDAALLELTVNGRPSFNFLDMSREKKGLRSLDRFLPEKPDLIAWDPHDAEQLYALSKGALSRIDLKHEEMAPNIFADLLGVGVKNRKLYLLKKDFSLFESGAKGENPTPILEDPSVGPAIFKGLSGDYFQIQVFRRDFLQKDLLLFLSNEGALASNRWPYRLVNENVRGVEYAMLCDDEKILYWTRNKIGVIHFPKEPETFFPPRVVPEEEKITEHFLLLEGAKNIRQAFWAHEDSHIVFLDGNKVQLLEAKGPKPYSVREITDVFPQSSIIYQDRKRTLYFLDAGTGQLLRMRLAD